MARTTGIMLTEDHLRALFAGEGVTYQPRGGMVFKVLVDSGVTVAGVEAILEEQAVADFLTAARDQDPDATLPSEPTAHRGVNEQAAEQIRDRRQRETGFAHVKWEDGGAWMVAPVLPPERVE